MIIEVTETLTADRTYYVRTSGATNPGSDSNDGLSDTAAGAFLTVQHAIDVAATLHLSIYDVTIKIADDTITTGIVLKSPSGSGSVIIEGNTTTPSNVHFNLGSGRVVDATNQSGIFVLKGFKLTGTNGIWAQNSTVQFKDLDFGTCSSKHIISFFNANVEATGNYTVSGNAAQHAYVQMNGTYNCASRTITYQNSPTFTYNFYVDQLGALQCQSMNFTNPGTVSGSRYSVTYNGLLNTGGGGASYIPGSTAGTSGTGGQYL